MKPTKARVSSGKSKTSRTSERPESEMSVARSVTSLSSTRSRPRSDLLPKAQPPPIRGAYKRMTRSFENDSSTRHRTSVHNRTNYSSTERLSEVRSGASYSRTVHDGQMPSIGIEAINSPRSQNVSGNIRSRNNFSNIQRIAVLNKVDQNKENCDDEEVDSVSMAGDKKEAKPAVVTALKK